MVGNRAGRVRPVSGPATAAMVALAAAAVTDLVWAFTPLAAVWSVREAAGRGGRAPGAVLLVAAVGVATLVLLAHVLAGAALAAWLHRVAANARVRGWHGWSPGLAAGVWFIPAAAAVLPPLIVIDVARAGMARVGRLVWAWWAAWLLGWVTLGAGTVLTYPPELVTLLSQVADGATVDVDRAGQLLGYQIAARLPGAVLLIAAAVLGGLVVSRVSGHAPVLHTQPPAPPVPSAPALPAMPAQRTPAREQEYVPSQLVDRSQQTVAGSGN
jgi:hypothetical protein